MKKVLFYIFTLVVIAAGCTGNKARNKLYDVDSLLTKDMPDSALAILEGIKDKNLQNEENQAYYKLLKTQTLYRLYKPITNDSMIDQSIRYYERYYDKDKLARAYYYKGELLCERGKTSDGIVFIKKAEQVVDKSNIILLHHIYTSLAFYNRMANEYDLSLLYIKKALACARKAKEIDWELYALDLMATDYTHLEKPDSADICIKQCLNLLDKASEEGLKFVLDDLGSFFQKTDPQKAEKFIIESLKLNPSAHSYILLAVLRYNHDNKADIEPLLKKAINMSDSKQKITVLQVWRDYKTAEKQYKEANELSIELTNLKDSVQKADKEQDLKAVQTAFDNKIKEEKNKQTMGYAALAIVILVATVVALMLYYKYKDAKLKQQLEQDRREIELINKQIEEARKIAAENEALRANKEKEIKQLQKRINTVEERHSGMLADGRKRYLEIEGGLTTVMWTKENFRNFVEYYKIVNPEFVNSLENDYSRLTEKNKTLMILEDMGGSVESIANTMGTSIGAVRTARSRIQTTRN